MAGTGRKSQVEKFLSRQGKAHADTMEIAKGNITKPKSDMDKGADLMNNVKPGTKTEDIVAAITREGMDTFLQLWNNSMQNTIKETLKQEREIMRQQIQEEMRTVIQEEIAGAMKGAVAGVTQALTGFTPFVQKNLDIDAVLDDDAYIEKETEPVFFEEFDSSDIPVARNPQIQAGETAKKEKKFSYSVPRTISCGICGEKGHNRKSCKKNQEQPEAKTELKLVK